MPPDPAAPGADVRRRALRDRRLRGPGPAQRRPGPDVDRADAERREHQPGRVLAAPPADHRPGVRPVRDRGGRGRGRDRPRDRDLDLPQPRDDQRRRGEPPQVVAAILLQGEEAAEHVAAAPNWFVEHAWIIVLIPLISAALTLFLGQRTPGRGSVYGIAAVGVSFVLSLGVLWQFVQPGGATY